MKCFNCVNLINENSGIKCMMCGSPCSPLLDTVGCPWYEEDYKENAKSVEWVLKSLNLEYGHILVRRKGRLWGQTATLGGGSAASVIKRFGSELVYTTDIVDNKLVLFVY